MYDRKKVTKTIQNTGSDVRPQYCTVNDSKGHNHEYNFFNKT